jgi:hypothetical protein
MMNRVKYNGLLCFIFISLSSNASVFYNKLLVNGASVYLDEQTNSVVHIDNKQEKKICKINNWRKEYNLGAGVISLTTDGKAILLANANSYMMVQELFKCTDSKINLYKEPVPTLPPFGRVIDLNFDKKIYLSLILEDAKNMTYSAMVARFDNGKNIILAKGFYNDKKNIDNAFYVGGVGYGGKISLNGQYVFPAEPDCSFDSYPGVWDIVNHGKVYFDTTMNSAEANDKCMRLFNGESTLESLGGKLMSSKEIR